MQVKQEITGRRPTFLSIEHRKTYSGNYASDFDFVEFSGLNPVAIIEEGSSMKNWDSYSVEMVKAGAKRMNVSYFEVECDESYPMIVRGTDERINSAVELDRFLRRIRK